MFLLYSFTHLEDFIRNVYSKLNITTPAQLHLNDIADDLNIGIFHLPSPSQALQFDGRYYIFLDSRLPHQNQFEEFGHELGHILLHTGNQQNMLVSYRHYQEWKADLFAFHFCMPTFMLLQLSNELLTSYKVSEIFGVSERFAHIRLEQFWNKQLYYQCNNRIDFVAENPP